MTKDDIELAKQAGVEIYELGKREAYLNQMRYTFDQQQLTKFAELIRAEKPLGEAFGYVDMSYLNNDGYRLIYVDGTIPEKTIPLYTTPPDQSAEIARLREALINSFRWANELECMLLNNARSKTAYEKMQLIAGFTTDELGKALKELQLLKW
jgi:hypothetical protein